MLTKLTNDKKQAFLAHVSNLKVTTNETLNVLNHSPIPEFALTFDGTSRVHEEVFNLPNSLRAIGLIDLIG